MNKKQISLDVIFVSIFFIIVFLLFAGAHHLISPDETRYTGIAWEMFHDNDYITPRLAGSPFLGKPILFYWWDILAFHIFGVSEFAARFFPAIIGAIGCIMAYVYGCIVFNRLTGFLMSSLLAAAPLYFGLTHYANMDGELAGWVTCTMLSFLVAEHYIRQGKPANFWLYLSYFFAALAFLTKGLIGIVFPAMIIFFWVLLLNDWRLLLKIRLISGLILFLVIITPWLYLCERANPGFLYYFFIFNQFFRFVGSGFNNQHSFFYFWPFVIIGIFPFTLYVIQGFGFHLANFHKTLKTHRHSLFIFLWLILITLFFSIPGGKPIGHIAPAIPASALLMAIYFVSVWKTVPSKFNYISSWIIVGILVVVSIALLSLPIFSDNTHLLKAMPYARFLSIVLALSAIMLVIWLIKQKPMSYIVTTLVFMTLLMNITLIASLKTFNLQLNWPIAQKILPYLKKYPNAQIVMVDQYYYSLPLYLGRNVGIVYKWDKIESSRAMDGWPREIYDGVEYVAGHKLSKEMINFSQFRKLWNNQSHLVVIAVTSIPPSKRLEKTFGEKQDDIKLIGRVPRRHAYLYINQ